MKRLFNPPEFDDEIKTHQAAMLHFILWVSIILPVPYAFFMIFLAKENPGEILGQALTAMLLDFVLLVILRSGNVHLAAWLQSLVFWMFFSILAATTSGVRGPAYLVGSGAVIVLAGALIGNWGASILTLLVCLTGGVLVYAEINNLLVFSTTRAPLSTWLIGVMLFPIIAVVQNLASTRLRRAFERARASESRNRAIVSALPDIIFRFSKEKTFLDYHVPDEQSLLIAPQQFINQSIYDVLPPSLAEITSQAIDRAFAANQIQVYEYSLQLDDGTHYYEARMCASSECEALAIVREITQQHRDKEQIKKLNEELEQRVAERTAQLQESEQRFRTLFENSPEGIFLMELHHPDLAWPIVDCNEVACRMNGYTREELIGKSINIVHHAPELSEYQKEFQPGIQRMDEVLHRKKDGTIFPIETSSSIIKIGGREYLLGIDRDITERKRIDAILAQRTMQLEESEKRFRVLFENSPDGIFLIDLEDTNISWPIVDCNEAACRMNGYTRDELIGKSIDIIHLEPELPENRAKWLALYRAYGKNDVQNLVEWPHRKKDGTVFLIETANRIITINGHEYLIGIDRDISERKQIEADLARRTAELEESEERFRVLFENSPEGIFLVDPYDPDVLWPIVDCNEVACRMNGYTKDELIGQPIDIVHSFVESREKREKFFTRFRQGGQNVLEVVHRRKDGSTFQIETSINIVEMNGREYVLGLDRDITERKRVETDLAQRTAQLQESELRFRTLFENSPDGIILMDPNYPGNIWPILDCNDVACKMNGYTRDELIGQPYNLLAFPSYEPNETRAFLQYLREVQHTFGEFTRRRKDGTFYPIESSVSLLEVNGKEFVMGIDRDVTERKRVEATLARQKNDLELANKELEAFSYSVSHDLRAPLRSISGFGKILQDDFSQSLNPQGRNYLNRMIEGAVQLNELIEGMLKISRLSSAQLNPVPLDLSQMSRELIDAFREQEPDRQVDVQIQEGITATADPTLMRNVLENLLGNAWKYTSKKERAEITFGMLTGEGKIVYFVRDNGAGFDMAYAEKLFGSFQRLHRNDEFPGHGIGLASVQRIIHKHNGNIWAEAEVDKGASFYFTLG